MDFADKFRIWVLEKYGSISKGAEALEMRQSELSRYLTRGINPGIKLLTKLNKHKAPIIWFLGFSDDKVNQNDEKDNVIIMLENEIGMMRKQIEELQKELIKYQVKLSKVKETLKDTFLE